MQLPVVVTSLLAAGLVCGSAIGPSSLDWKPRPDWLGNPSADIAICVSSEAVRFSTRGAGRGMKWSAKLPQDADASKTPWLLVRYRGISAGGDDYSICLATESGEVKAVVPATALALDGAWHTLLQRLDPLKADTVAVQVQARSKDGWMELSRLELSEERPALSVTDLLDVGRPNWRHMSAIDISPLCSAPVDTMKAAWLLNDWFVEEVSVSGASFRMAGGAVARIAQELVLPTSGLTASEVLLLIGAVKTADKIDPPLSEPHAFYAVVEYEDGTSDRSIPARLPGSFGLAEGLGVYAIVTDAGKAFKRISLRAHAGGIDAYLIAATAGTDTTLARYARPGNMVRAVPYERDRHGQDAPWRFDCGHWEIVCTNGSRRVVIALNPGVSMRVEPDRKSRIGWESPLWTLSGGSRTSKSFRGKITKSGERSATVELSDRSAPQTRGVLTIDGAEPGKLRLSLSLSMADQSGSDITFPSLQGITHGGKAELTYCFPRRSAVVNSSPVDLRESYSGAFPVQFVDVSGPEGGVYVMTQGRDDTARSYHLAKSEHGLTMKVEYPRSKTAAFESISTVIGFHDSDWHDALDAYRDWLKTWYKPTAPRKQWFREVFNLRQQFLRFYSITDGTYYDANTHKFTFPQGLERDRSFFGGVDYLHIFDWGMQHQHGLGDYRPWGADFPPDEFRKSIEQVKASGVPVGLYIEGYLASLESEIGKAHGKEWEIVDSAGKPVRAYSIYTMCPAVEGWQDHLASVYGRVRDETGADGFYVDQYGYGFAHYNCFSPNHGHDVPASPLKGEGETLAKIRRALGPDKLLYTEYPPTDVQSQLLDGAFEKAVCFGSDELSPSRVNLTRFAWPDFKTFEIIMLDEPLGDRRHQLGLTFFNGEGLWLEGPADTWYSPEALSLIRKMYALMREHRDCFTSLDPVPLVPTGHARVFANQFAGNGRTLWTLYNSGHSTIRGDLLAVRHVDGSRYIDAWNGVELKPSIARGVARLTIALGPKEVGCVVQELPQARQNQQMGERR
jgi:hypothetical protein